jgi:hypothetical protein
MIRHCDWPRIASGRQTAQRSHWNGALREEALKLKASLERGEYRLTRVAGCERTLVLVMTEYRGPERVDSELHHSYKWP